VLAWFYLGFTILRAVANSSLTHFASTEYMINKIPAVAMLAALFAVSPTFAQTDPGPRPGPPTPSRPLPGLSAAALAYFNAGLARFTEIDSVSGTQPGATGTGLGPRFNMNSCAGCHNHPGPGGSSPQVNPQIAVATSYGATNTIPAFITQNGPIRAVRFVRNADGSPDGGVHDLFTITGRSDAAGCQIAQPDFATAVAQNNTGFRIPTPLFGAGLMEAITDTAILANKAANAQAKAALGIQGQENRSANDGTITRFGWKAQNKSLVIFGGEAYNVEQGVTNEVFPTERDETPGCGFNQTPEDRTDYTASSLLTGMSDVTGFAAFMRFLAPPQPAQPANPAGNPGNPSVANGQQAFTQVGCALCHTQIFTTGDAFEPALRNQQAQLWSDLLLHNMGTGLADGISQGNANGNQWRTAPLWGLGERLFFLHDGRTSDLVQAIQAHSSPNSEANGVVAGFNALPTSTKQDIINFLRSL
jgi:CxxC motif-containing protein (DUF1111 family)